MSERLKIQVWTTTDTAEASGVYQTVPYSNGHRDETDEEAARREREEQIAEDVRVVAAAKLEMVHDEQERAQYEAYKGPLFFRGERWWRWFVVHRPTVGPVLFWTGLRFHTDRWRARSYIWHHDARDHAPMRGCDIVREDALDKYLEVDDWMEVM